MEDDNEPEDGEEESNDEEIRISMDELEEYDEEVGSGGDPDTYSERLRWRYTNDILAGALLISLPVIIGIGSAGVVDPSVVPADIRYAWITTIGIATVWAFGTEAARALYELRGGDRADGG